MSLQTAIITFIALSLVIGFAGTFLSKTADQLADTTGLGEAIFGAVLLGGVTSLSGIVTSFTSAWQGHPQLSVSNALGGIAAQTVFLAIADMVYRGVNLEHAAASLANVMQGLLLIIILSLVTALMALPELVIWHFHPASVALILIYGGGVYMVSKAQKDPMWQPKHTRQTVEDEPEEEQQQKRLLPLVIKFVLLGGVVAVAGYFLARSAIVIAGNTGLSESFVGSLFTAVATSLPELVVAISAVRQGALTLAVANIIGGNAFDVLFLAFSDFGYRDGSIYHHITDSQYFILALTLVLTGVLTLGLLVRQKEGIIKIGWESATIILLYLGGNVLIYFLG